MEWGELWSQPGQFSLEWRDRILTHLYVTRTSSFYLVTHQLPWGLHLPIRVQNSNLEPDGPAMPVSQRTHAWHTIAPKPGSKGSEILLSTLWPVAFAP